MLMGRNIQTIKRRTRVDVTPHTILRTVLSGRLPVAPLCSRLEGSLKSLISRMVSEHHLYQKDLLDVNNTSFFVGILDGICMKRVRESASVTPYLPDSSHRVSGFGAGMSGILSRLPSSRCNTDSSLLEYNRARTRLSAFVCAPKVCAFVSVSMCQYQDWRNLTGVLAPSCCAARKTTDPGNSERRRERER